MVPLFLVLAAPLAEAAGRPTFALVHALARGSDAAARDSARGRDPQRRRRSFPLDSPKVRGIGHAIDVSLFVPPASRDASPTLRLLALGRTARWKGYETMLAALELAVAAGADAVLELRGPQLTDDEQAHRRELEATVAGSDVLRMRVRIEPPAPRAELPRLLAATDALLSATQPRGGSETLDKVVYEAAACGVPVLASNTALDEFLGGLPLELRFPARDPRALADRLLALAAAGPERRDEVGAELRRRVVEEHSLDSWANGVVAALAGQRPE